MRVLILSGNQAGTVVDLPRIEAEAAICTGYAALAPEAAPAKVVEDHEGHKAKAEPKRRG